MNAYSKRHMFTFLILTVCMISVVGVELTQAAKQNRRGEVSSPLFGGDGGKPYNLSCRRGSVLIGIQARTGEFIDSLKGICRKVNRDGTLGSTTQTRETGGRGGTIKIRSCKKEGVVRQISVDTTGSYLRNLVLRCGKWDPQTKRVRTKSSGSIILGSFVGERRFDPSALFTNSAHESFSCPDGNPGKALRGKSGIYIDSVRLVCDRVWVTGGKGKAEARKRAKQRARGR